MYWNVDLMKREELSAAELWVSPEGEVNLRSQSRRCMGSVRDTSPEKDNRNEWRLKLKSNSSFSGTAIERPNENEPLMHNSSDAKDVDAVVSFADGNDNFLTEFAWRLWVATLMSRKQHIFDSPEAKSATRSKSAQGECAYEGIGVTISNCDGLRHVLNYYRSVGCARGGPQEWDTKDLTTTISQFLRWSVSHSCCDKHEVRKKESLFESACHLSRIKQFIRFFQDCCGDRTVKQKADGLIIVRKAAQLVTRRTQTAKLTHVSFVLASVASSKGKREAHFRDLRALVTRSDRYQACRRRLSSKNNE
ncbi:hypothetical protein FGB62_301g09 [Gracilaria domingensis]|nr:hypothetical protein FGB62_301g09 [Gracilaria domingensis]